MNKTLPLMLVAFAVVALASAPSASACMIYGNPTANYVVCDRGYVSDTEDYATQTVGDVLAFVTQEASDAAAFVLGIVNDALP